MNEFGCIEVISQDLTCDETMNSSSEMDTSETIKTEPEAKPDASGDNDKTKQATPKTKGMLQ